MSHHDTISVVDMEGAQKNNNLKFDHTLSGCVICCDTTPEDHMKKVIHIRDRVKARTRTHGSVAHVPSNRTLVATSWSQTKGYRQR